MRSLRERVRRVFHRPSGFEYWEERARTHGPRAVLNLAHTADEIEAVKARQQAILFPKLAPLLDGREQLALDYGCGTGRFSVGLAEMTSGLVVAVDPIQQLLDLAPVHPRVAYRRLTTAIPMAAASADLVWISIVLGCIADACELRCAAADVARVLKPGGLLFLVENTAEKRGPRHFKFRSEAEYMALFPTVALQTIGFYEDAGERISILAGRSHQRPFSPLNVSS